MLVPPGLPAQGDETSSYVPGSDPSTHHRDDVFVLKLREPGTLEALRKKMGKTSRLAELLRARAGVVIAPVFPAPSLARKSARADRFDASRQRHGLDRIYRDTGVRRRPGGPDRR